MATGRFDLVLTLRRPAIPKLEALILDGHFYYAITKAYGVCFLSEPHQNRKLIDSINEHMMNTVICENSKLTSHKILLLII